MQLWIGQEQLHIIAQDKAGQLPACRHWAVGKHKRTDVALMGGPAQEHITHVCKRFGTRVAV